MKTIDANLCKKLRPLMQKALENVLKAEGLSVSIGTMRFTPEDLRFKVELKKPSDPSKVKEVFNIPTGDLVGRRFKQRNSIYEILSLDPKKPGNVIGRTNRGKRYTIPVGHLATMTEL